MVQQLNWSERDGSHIGHLVGKTLIRVSVDDADDHDGDSYHVIEFESDDGSTWQMFHEQECCEHVSIEDICGNIDDIVGSTILDAREDFREKEIDEGIQGWTFYTIRTTKGTVTIRWSGESNGYYSVGVDFYKRAPR